MTRLRSIRLVARREILERGRSRGFLFSIGFTTLIIIASFVVPAILFDRDDARSSSGWADGWALPSPS
jgi:ABC-type Na+ efflux pump permease subunit